jgi:hypothetical protein
VRGTLPQLVCGDFGLVEHGIFILSSMNTVPSLRREQPESAMTSNKREQMAPAKCLLRLDGQRSLTLERPVGQRKCELCTFY